MATMRSILRATLSLSWAISSAAVQAATITVDVVADIDGRDQLIIHRNTLKWRHFDYVPVGLHNAAFPSTILTTAVDGKPGLSEYAWTPTWPAGTGTGAVSSTLAGVLPDGLLEPLSVSLVVEQARYAVTLVQRPSAENDYTTIVDFNDNPISGDALYQAKLVFNTETAARPQAEAASAPAASLPAGQSREEMQRALNQQVMATPFNPGDARNAKAYAEQAKQQNQTPVAQPPAYWAPGWTCNNLTTYVYYNYLDYRNCVYYYSIYGRYWR